MRARIGCFVVCAAIASSLTGVNGSASAQATADKQAKPSADSLAVRVQVLEDRDAIRALLVSYARTLDERDFAGFEQLWARMPSSSAAPAIRRRVRQPFGICSRAC